MGMIGKPEWEKRWKKMIPFFILLAFGRNELREACQWRMFLGCLSHETPCSRICTSHHSSYCMYEVNQLNLWPFGPKATNNMFPPFYCAITEDNRDKVMLLLQPFSCLFVAKKKKNGVNLTKDPQIQCKSRSTRAEFLVFHWVHHRWCKDKRRNSWQTLNYPFGTMFPCTFFFCDDWSEECAGSLAQF